MAWERPEIRYVFERLGSFARWVHFDKRGTGVSDRSSGLASFDQRVDDALAVMDAAGMDRAWVCGLSEGGPMAVVLAATHPARVQGLVLINSGAALVDPSETAETRARRWSVWDSWIDQWGPEDTVTLDVFAPSVAADPSYRRWQSRYERQSASPGALRELMEMIEQIDARAVARTLSIPPLVLHQAAEGVWPIDAGRELAALIPGARFMAVPGGDHFVHVGDVDVWVEEMREFTTGTRGSVATTASWRACCSPTSSAPPNMRRRWVMAAGSHCSGNTTWRQTVADHRGCYVKSTGDRVLAYFDSPARAVAAGRTLRDRAADIGLDLSTGIHTGELELTGEDIGGISVHIAARIADLAEPGEILVSRTVKDLVIDSQLRFEERGVHRLKGVGGRVVDPRRRTLMTSVQQRGVSVSSTRSRADADGATRTESRRSPSTG